ncbi:MAG: TIGR00303 family protein [Nitrososphaera sp.]|nr:TIGR00303 family protein [Nitrososphaera sp.]
MHPDISASGGRSIAKQFSAKNPVFACVISYTATSEIPGLTVAGANPEMVRYTPAADAEFLYYGRCKCIDSVPATPDGKPTPALISRAALQLAGVPVFVIDAGARVKPSIPFFSMGLEPGRNITVENAMELADVKRAFEDGAMLGKMLAGSSDLVVVGESIPGGTTTALAVLIALEINARFKISSSMPDNPHKLKNEVVASAVARAGVRHGSVVSPFVAVSLVGDPMMPTVAGIASGALATGRRVMLAGGTQMAAVLAILKLLGRPLGRLCIGTTSYIANDRSSDLHGLVRQIANVPVLSCELHLGESRKPGLRAYADGFVKEGVGAGGAALTAMLGSKKITGKKLLHAIEKEYEESIEAIQRTGSSLPRS